MKNAAIGAVLRKLNAIDGVKAIKLPSIAGFLESGTPDILIVDRGRPILVEVKHGRQKSTPIQLKRAAEWAAAGATVAVCRTPAEVLALVDPDEIFALVDPPPDLRDNSGCKARATD